MNPRSPLARSLLFCAMVVAAGPALGALGFADSALGANQIEDPTQKPEIHADLGVTEFTVAVSEVISWLVIGVLASVFIRLLSSARGKDRAFGWIPCIVLGMLVAVGGGLLVNAIWGESGLGGLEIDHADLTAAGAGSVIVIVLGSVRGRERKAK